MKPIKCLLLAGCFTSTLAFAQQNRLPAAPPLPPAPVQARPTINQAPVSGFNPAPVNGFSQRPVNGFSTPQQAASPVGPNAAPQFNPAPVTGFNPNPVGDRTTLPPPITVPQPNVVAQPAPVNGFNPSPVAPAFTNAVAPAPVTNLPPPVAAPAPF